MGLRRTAYTRLTRAWSYLSLKLPCYHTALHYLYPADYHDMVVYG